MSEEKEKTLFQELTRKKYIDQAKWFLNGFWEQGIESEKENIWKYTQKFIELDDKRKKEGNELDEFLAHKFLEYLGETLTVIQLRERLRKIDMDCNGKMALLEYLAFKYAKGVRDVVYSPQGDNQLEIDEAAEKLQAVQDAFAEVQTQLDQQTRAFNEQVEAEAASKKALDDQKRAEQEAHVALTQQREAEESARKALEDQRNAEEIVKKTEAELKAAVDEMTRQEMTYQESIRTLETKSKDSTASTVSKNKAAAELAVLKQEDPLPLRKAKLTQEAILRKVEKERKASEAATALAEAKSQKAEAATQAAEVKAQEAQEATKSAQIKASEAEEKVLALAEQKKRVEEAFADAEVKVKEAVDYLNEVKQKGGVAHGAIWWMERELTEAQKYMPKKKINA